MAAFNEVVDYANAYSASGLSIFALQHGSKKPHASLDWTQIEYTADEVEKLFSSPLPLNIGLKLSSDQKNYRLLDIDIDMLGVGAIATQLLPPTAIFGRIGKMFSHFIYDISDFPLPIKTISFKDFFQGNRKLNTKIDSKARDEVKKNTLLEIRVGNHYVMVPPSIHDSKEMVFWHDTRGNKTDFTYPVKLNPEQVTDVLSRARLLAGAIFLSRHWPESGSRHDPCLFVAGGLISAGLSLELTEAFITVVCELAGDTHEFISDRLRTIESTYKRYENDEPIAGWGALENYIDLEIIHELRKMLFLPSLQQKPEARLSDRGSARRLIMENTNFRFLPKLRTFFAWSGMHWQETTEFHIATLVKKSIDKLTEDLLKVKSLEARAVLQKFALQSENTPKLRNVVESLKSEEEVMVDFEDMDVNPYLFNVLNGSIDLRDGSLQPHDSTEYISKLCPVTYTPAAQAPRFLQFLSEIMDGNQNLIGYLQRYFGYCLTGLISEKSIHFMYGPLTDNGKTTLMNIVTRLMGEDYTGVIAYDDMMRHKDGTSKFAEALSKVYNKRLVIISEPPKDMVLNEAKMRAVTGGNKLQARVLYKGFFEFYPMFKLVVETNHLPKIDVTSTASWNRVRIAPFEVQIPKEKQIQNFAEIILSEEKEGVLAWMVEGAKRFFHEGRLIEVPEVVLATEQHRSSMDTVAEFISERIEKEDLARGPKVTDVYFEYLKWCRMSHEEPLDKREFKTGMIQHRMELYSPNGALSYKGIKLLRDTTPEIVIEGMF